MSVTGAIRGDPASIKALTQFLIDEVSKPEPDLPCPVASRTSLSALIVALGPLVLEHDKISFFSRTRKHYPGLLRALVRFLTAPRDAAARRTLCAHQCHCDLDRADRFLGEAHTVTPPDHPTHALNNFAQRTPMTRFLEEAMQIVWFCYGQVLTRGVQKLVKEAQRKHVIGLDIWPADVRDLAPYGQEETIQSICRWNDVAPGPCTTVLSWAANTWRLVGYPSRPRILLCTILPEVFLSRIQRVLKDFDSKRTKSPAPARMLDDFATIRGVLLHLESVPEQVLAAILRPHRDTPWVRALLDACMTASVHIRALEEEIRPGGQPLGDGRNISRPYTSCAVRLHTALGLTFPSAPDKHVRAFRELHLQDVKDPIYVLWTFLAFPCPAPQTPHVCGNAACGRSSITGSGCRMLLCKGCAGMHYCSRECQRAAWTCKAAPHKDVCTTLRVIMDEIVCGAPLHDLDHDMFSLGCMDAGLTTDSIFQVIEHMGTVYGR